MNKNNIIFKRFIYILGVIAILIGAILFTEEPISAGTIEDGDLIKSAVHENVYIVKIVGNKKFKRLILNPEIFNQYGHLSWNNIKTVSESTFREYELSALVRMDGGNKIYKLIGNGDTGEKRWISTTAEEFDAVGLDWDSVYTINQNERDSYVTASTLYYSELSSRNFDYGIIPGISSTADINKAEELGVTIVRLSPNDLSFTKNDLKSRGIDIMVQKIDNKPSGMDGVPPPSDYNQWAQELKQVVRNNPDVKYWQVWNEPNEILYWYPNPNAGEYVKLLKASYLAIKDANPDAVVISAGLSGINPPKQYLRDMYQEGAEPYFDVLALHPYGQPNSPDTYLKDYILYMKNIMETYGDINKPIWITEIGWPTKEDEFGAVSAAEQAEYLKRTYEISQGIDLIKNVFWYRMQDAGEGMGIIGKPAEDVYKNLTN
ncbi:MAG: glycosyl hydrolase [Candidatus Spechtbacterales bacterium]|nr:glycosyl hydrolase [Candidatus Spechtbacterales bacterium]